jgi:hypothetical protein
VHDWWIRNPEDSRIEKGRSMHPERQTKESSIPCKSREDCAILFCTSAGQVSLAENHNQMATELVVVEPIM